MSRPGWAATGLVLVLSACGGAAPATEQSASSPAGASAGPSEGSQSPPPLIPSSPPSPAGPTTSAAVTRVADGQTIEVSIDGHTAIVRYIGLSIPVSVGPSSSGPSIVQQASAANANLVVRQAVILEQDVSDADASGRLLRYVWVQNGGRLTLVNLALVSLGLARVATTPPDVRYDALLRAAEAEARDAQRGLWAFEQSMPSMSPAPGASAGAGGVGSPSAGARGVETPAAASPTPTGPWASNGAASDAASP
jgi:micrococcal nuclease